MRERVLAVRQACDTDLGIFRVIEVVVGVVQDELFKAKCCAGVAEKK